MRLALVPFALLLLAGPALAADLCNAPAESGIHFKVTISHGKRTLETQQQLDLMTLRQHGINARTVTRNGDGCLEAWIPDGKGGFRTEYYHPDTLERKFNFELPKATF